MKIFDNDINILKTWIIEDHVKRQMRENAKIDLDDILNSEFAKISNRYLMLSQALSKSEAVSLWHRNNECPVCRNELYEDSQNYCDKCGQKIHWLSEEECIKYRVEINSEMKRLGKL